MVLIIYCHPSRNSHNGKILHTIEEELKKNKKTYEILDLYADNFNGVFKTIEYKRIKERIRETEEDVIVLQEKIKKASSLVFIYPVWWYNMPALLKGFMDRVFSNGFAYRFKRTPKWMEVGAQCISFIPGLRYFFQPYAAQGFLSDKKAFIFRTYGGPPLGRRFFGNTVGVLENNILRFCGLTKIRITELYNIDKSVFTEKDEATFLKTVKKRCQEM